MLNVVHHLQQAVLLCRRVSFALTTQRSRRILKGTKGIITQRCSFPCACRCYFVQDSGFETLEVIVFRVEHESTNNTFIFGINQVDDSLLHRLVEHAVDGHVSNQIKSKTVDVEFLLLHALSTTRILQKVVLGVARIVDIVRTSRLRVKISLRSLWRRGRERSVSV